MHHNINKTNLQRVIMSKQTKSNHNPRNPNICRNCKVNTIGKNRMAFGHTVCQACSTKQESLAEQGEKENNNEQP
jgi:hypothetical protein